MLSLGDINYIKFISRTGGAENYFANVSIGYAHACTTAMLMTKLKASVR